MNRKTTRGIAAILVGAGIGLIWQDSLAVSYISGVLVGGGVVATFF